MAVDLLQRHLQTLVAEPEQWQTLIADDIVWELAYAPALGHPARLSGREEAIHHASWFAGAVENFRFFDLKLYSLTDEHSAIAEVKAEGLITSTGRDLSPGLCRDPESGGRQDCVHSGIL